MSLADVLGDVSPSARPDVETRKRAASTTATRRDAPKPARLDVELPKSRHPDWKKLTTYVRKATQTEAEYLLAKDGGKKDLADLIEELLQGFIAGGGRG